MQVGADPRLVSGLEDLLDEQGCEVYIKRPDRYGLKPLQRFTWSQVSLAWSRHACVSHVRGQGCSWDGRRQLAW